MTQFACTFDDLFHHSTLNWLWKMYFGRNAMFTTYCSSVRRWWHGGAGDFSFKAFSP